MILSKNVEATINKLTPGNNHFIVVVRTRKEYTDRHIASKQISDVLANNCMCHVHMTSGILNSLFLIL